MYDRGWWLRRTLALPSHHDRQSVDDGHHHPLVSTTPSLSRVPPPPLLIGHGAREYRPTIEVSRVRLILQRPGRGRVALGPLQQSHDVRLERVRFADDRRHLLLVLVGVRMPVGALHGDRVPHAWRYNVRQALDCVSSVDFVPRYAGYLVHSDGDAPFPMRALIQFPYMFALIPLNTAIHLSQDSQHIRTTLIFLSQLYMEPRSPVGSV